jgi:hypothetical protein
MKMKTSILALLILAGSANAALILVGQSMNGVVVELNRTAGYDTVIRFANFTLAEAVFAPEYVVLNGTYLTLKPQNPPDLVEATVLSVAAENKTVYATCAGPVEWVIGGFNVGANLTVYENWTSKGTIQANGTGYMNYTNTPNGWYSFVESTPTTTTTQPSGGDGGHRRITTTTEAPSTTQPSSTTQSTTPGIPTTSILPPSTAAPPTTVTPPSTLPLKVTTTATTLPSGEVTQTTVPKTTGSTLEAPSGGIIRRELRAGENAKIRVYDKDGNPYHGTVTVEGPDGVRITLQTDQEGYVNLEAKIAGNWTIRPVEASGVYGGLGLTAVVLFAVAAVILLAILLRRRRTHSPPPGA